MKLTSEELLMQLGIEIGKPYLRNGKKETVLSIHEEHKTFNVQWTNALGEERVDWNTAHYFVNCDITQLPKYTLTETEKHIVLAIDEKFKTLYKLGNDSVALYTVGGERHYLTVFGEIFGSIPLNNYVSLDELREIAKK